MQKLFMVMVCIVSVTLCMQHEGLELELLEAGGFTIIPAHEEASTYMVSNSVVTFLNQTNSTNALNSSAGNTSASIDHYLGGQDISNKYYEYEPGTGSGGAVLIEVLRQNYFAPIVGRLRCAVLTGDNTIKTLTDKEYSEWPVVGEITNSFTYKVEKDDAILLGVNKDAQFALTGYVITRDNLLELVIELRSLYRAFNEFSGSISVQSEIQKTFDIDPLMLPVEGICGVFSGDNTRFAVKARLQGSNNPEVDEYWFVYDIKRERALCLIYTNKLISFVSNDLVVDSDGKQYQVVQNWP